MASKKKGLSQHGSLPAVPSQILNLPKGFTSQEWMTLVEGEAGESVVSSIVDDIMSAVLAQATQRHVERHINPRAVEMAYHAVMYMVELYCLNRDEGERDYASDPSWAAGEEPATPQVDTWARGFLPVTTPPPEQVRAATSTLVPPGQRNRIASRAQSVISAARTSVTSRHSAADPHHPHAPHERLPTPPQQAPPHLRKDSLAGGAAASAHKRPAKVKAPNSNTPAAATNSNNSGGGGSGGSGGGGHGAGVASSGQGQLGDAGGASGSLGVDSGAGAGAGGAGSSPTGRSRGNSDASSRGARSRATSQAPPPSFVFTTPAETVGQPSVFSGTESDAASSAPAPADSLPASSALASSETSPTRASAPPSATPADGSPPAPPPRSSSASAAGASSPAGIKPAQRASKSGGGESNTRGHQGNNGLARGGSANSAALSAAPLRPEAVTLEDQIEFEQQQGAEAAEMLRKTTKASAVVYAHNGTLVPVVPVRPEKLPSHQITPLVAVVDSKPAAGKRLPRPPPPGEASARGTVRPVVKAGSRPLPPPRSSAQFNSLEPVPPIARVPR